MEALLLNKLSTAQWTNCKDVSTISQLKSSAHLLETLAILLRVTIGFKAEVS
jgi:hypothetical protein